MPKLNVLGWKHSKGTLEDGTPYDFINLYSIGRLQPSDSTSGSAGIDIRALPSVINDLKKIDFSKPVQCDVEIETMATGKGMFKEVAVGVTAVQTSALPR